MAFDSDTRVFSFHRFIYEQHSGEPPRLLTPNRDGNWDEIMLHHDHHSLLRQLLEAAIIATEEFPADNSERTAEQLKGAKRTSEFVKIDTKGRSRVHELRLALGDIVTQTLIEDQRKKGYRIGKKYPVKVISQEEWEPIRKSKKNDILSSPQKPHQTSIIRAQPETALPEIVRYFWSPFIEGRIPVVFYIPRLLFFDIGERWFFRDIFVNDDRQLEDSGGLEIVKKEIRDRFAKRPSYHYYSAGTIDGMLEISKFLNAHNQKKGVLPHPDYYPIGELRQDPPPKFADSHHIILGSSLNNLLIKDSEISERLRFSVSQYGVFYCSEKPNGKPMPLGGEIGKKGGCWKLLPNSDNVKYTVVTMFRQPKSDLCTLTIASQSGRGIESTAKLMTNIECEQVLASLAMDLGPLSGSENKAAVNFPEFFQALFEIRLLMASGVPELRNWRIIDTTATTLQEKDSEWKARKKEQYYCYDQFQNSRPKIIGKVRQGQQRTSTETHDPDWDRD